MLVIRRRAGDAIRIGEEIEVEILEITATRVVLGVTAPNEVRVLRKEVVLAAQENQAAAESAKKFAAGKISSYFTLTPR